MSKLKLSAYVKKKIMIIIYKPAVIQIYIQGESMIGKRAELLV